MKTTHKFILCSLFLLSTLRITGQADSILSLPEDIQAHALYSWAAPLYSWSGEKPALDSVWFLSGIDQMYKGFMKAGREDLARMAWSIMISFLISRSGLNEQKALDLVDQALAHTSRHDWPIQEAELYFQKGFILRNHGHPVPGFENQIKGYERMRQIGFDKFPLAYYYLYHIGLSYYYVKAYDQAAIYIRQALETPRYKPDLAFTTVGYNTLGVCYIRQQQYDSAIVAFQKSHDFAVKADMTAYVGLTKGNMGYCYFKLGDDDRALPLLEEDFRISTEMHEINSALNASLALAAIYLKRGLRDKAEYHMAFASQHVNRGDNRAMQSYYANLSDLREIAHDFKSALSYRDSSVFYQERIQATEEKDILERARLELEIEKHQNAVTSLEARRKRQILLRNGMLVIVVLSGILILSLIQRRYLRRKRQLEQARKELTTFTDMIREKNEMLDAFSHEIETLRATDQHISDERTQHLTALMNSHILTEDDWKEFRNLFDKVHPGFFVRLKEQMPDLTNAETRLLALTKLQLAPREMASMLGISYDSILKSRQRLRKKINLPEEGTLDELLKMI